MSDVLEPVYAALREVLAEAWPEALPNGFYEADHASLIPWERFTTPYAVIAIDDLSPVAGGATNDAYAPEVSLFYVDAVSGPLSGIRGKLDLLRRTLNDWDQSKLQVVEVTGITWADDLPANALFVANGKASRAGLLRVQILVGESLNPSEEETP